MEEIELRSEEVRRIIGEVPPLLIRCGIGIIGAILLVLTAIVTLFPYPEIVETHVTLTETDGHLTATTPLPHRYLSQLKEGTKVLFAPDGQRASEGEESIGSIESIQAEPSAGEDSGICLLHIVWENSGTLKAGMSGTLSIRLSNGTLLKKLYK